MSICAALCDRENAAHASRLIEETCSKEGIEPDILTLHSAREAPMTVTLSCMLSL